MKYLAPKRVKHALHNIHEWALAAQSQKAVHIMPLLALLEKGAGTTASVIFEEDDDFNFWDRYFNLRPGTAKPYFNAVGLRWSEKGFPHSNAATIRKNTFYRRWGAGQFSVDESGNTHWFLAEDYADIFREKVLVKSSNEFKISALDLSILIFRNTEWLDTATTDDIIQHFRETFPQKSDDFSTLFKIQTEDPEHVFLPPGESPQPNPDDVLAEELVLEVSTPPKVKTAAGPKPLETQDDPVLTEVQQLLELGTSGVVFSGPPGTGKTRYAQRIAASIVENPDTDVFRVQFHPSYGYEDFVEGFVPDDEKTSGFAITPKKFLTACRRALDIDGYVCVVIDEINRGDPARIFGEILTYIEPEYRGEEFLLPFSGERVAIPANIFILGTMNPYDRSVTQVDAAFMRRFDHIFLEPSSDVVREFLEGGDFTNDQIEEIVKWFIKMQDILPIGLGHSFFKDVRDIDKLNIVWKYRIRPAAETILDFDPERRQNFLDSFRGLLGRLGYGD